MQTRSPRQELARGVGQIGGGSLLVVVGVVILLVVGAAVRRLVQPVDGRPRVETLLISTAYAKAAVQCRGTTAKGLQCRNRTTNEPPYCYRHRSQAPRPKDASVLPQ